MSAATLYGQADVRDLGSSHAKFVTRIGAVVCSAVVAGGATAGASPMEPAVYGLKR